MRCISYQSRSVTRLSFAKQILTPVNETIDAKIYFTIKNELEILFLNWKQNSIVHLWTCFLLGFEPINSLELQRSVVEVKFLFKIIQVLLAIQLVFWIFDVPLWAWKSIWNIAQLDFSSFSNLGYGESMSSNLFDVCCLRGIEAPLFLMQKTRDLILLLNCFFWILLQLLNLFNQHCFFSDSSLSALSSLSAMSSRHSAWSICVRKDVSRKLLLPLSPLRETNCTSSCLKHGCH